MKLVYTITVDVQPSGQVQVDEREGDPVESELAYWEDAIDTHISGITYQYDKLVRAAASRLDYQQIDFTQVSVRKERLDD